MVASDGGVFAFGDARFEGSCPGIGGCSGAAVAVVPDASGNGYWLITQTGQRLCLRRRTVLRCPGRPGLAGHLRRAHSRRPRVLGPAGQWRRLRLRGRRRPGGPVGSVGGLNPASAIFSDADGGGYWVAIGPRRGVPLRRRPQRRLHGRDHLNGSIIAATGF